MAMSEIVRARRRVGFDARFHERDPLFAPIAAAAGLFASFHDFPPVDALDAALHGAAGVSFVPAKPAARYDACIALEARVPTRARSWHDFLNALVWATFPKAKRALHARQHRAIAASPDRGARTRELDALALLDEGGVLLLRDAAMHAVVFGHAIYETLVLGGEPPTAAAVVVEGDPDASLAAALADPGCFTTPEDLLRVQVGGLRGAGAS